MKIISDTSLDRFEAWSGGKDTLDRLSSDDIETIEAMLEDLYPDGMTDTAVNDFLWFDGDTIAEWLGYTSWEAYTHGIDDWTEYAREVIAENFPDADEDIVDYYVEECFEEETYAADIIKEFAACLADNAEDEDED